MLSDRTLRIGPCPLSKQKARPGTPRREGHGRQPEGSERIGRAERRQCTTRGRTAGSEAQQAARGWRSRSAAMSAGPPTSAAEPAAWLMQCGHAVRRTQCGHAVRPCSAADAARRCSAAMQCGHAVRPCSAAMQCARPCSAAMQCGHAVQLRRAGGIRRPERAGADSSGAGRRWTSASGGTRRRVRGRTGSGVAGCRHDDVAVGRGVATACLVVGGGCGFGWAAGFLVAVAVAVAAGGEAVAVPRFDA